MTVINAKTEVAKHKHEVEKTTCLMCTWPLPPCYAQIPMLLDHITFQIPASKVPSQMLLHSVLSYYFGIGYCHYDFSVRFPHPLLGIHN